MKLVLASFIIPLIIGIALFRLDGRKANIVMISSFFFAMIFQVVNALNYLKTMHHEKVIHVPLLATERLGEVYGIIIDPMSVLIGTVVAVAGFIFMFYGIEYMSPRNRHHPVKKGKGLFYAWMTIFEGATLGFIYSSTFLQLLIFFELMGLACWGVVSYYGTPAGYRAGFKAFIVPNIGAIIGFYTAIWLGITQLHDLSLFALKNLDESLKLPLFLALLIAGYTKSAQFPTYSWIPDAMAAPTPASAFLHGAAMVEMGVYLVARVLQFMAPLPIKVFYIMGIFVSLTLLVAVLNYPAQKDAKRLLAYSTIAEAGVMFVGLVYASLGYISGIQAAMYQLTTHAFIKGLAFLTAGTFSYSLGTLDMTKIKGLKDILPLNGFAWSVALLGLAGIPPMGIAFSKAEILTNLKAMEISWFAWVPIIFVLLDSIVFFAVAITWIKRMVLSKTERKKPHTHWMINISLATLIVLSLIVAFIALPLVEEISFLR
ncbi:hydrogenase 4 subunit D [Thermococcus sp. M39]|uniref:hydrogenase 4 subunit D n=1 Tax=Thermococcus sp. M39 TaxID=1638262 RepID=UPI003211E62A